MPNAHFLTLDEAVLPPPLPAVLALLVVAGLAHLGWRLALGLRGERASPLEVAAGFVVATGLAGAAAHALALAQLSRPEVLRVGGWMLAATGAYEIARFGRSRAARLAALSKEFFQGLRPIERTAVMLALFAALGLALAALGPPTDADSLDYHLGVPLDWLRRGGAHAGDLWLNARLVGLGEALNMLGLALGTDALGAVLQAAGLVVAVVAVGTLAQSHRPRALAILMTVTIPALLFLVPNQKPQLLPAAATTVALVLLVQAAENGQLDRTTLQLAFGSGSVAIGCKYSFILSGGIVFLAGTCMAWRRRMALPAATIALGAVLVQDVPVWTRNWVFYGDPLSPLLERFRAHPDPFVTAFATYLREYGGEPGLQRLMRLSVELVVPDSPGTISTVLGVGVLAVFTIRVNQLSARWLVACAIAATLLVLLGGQTTARFFLEPYLWVAAAVAGSTWSRGKNLLVWGLGLQAALMVALASFAAVRLLPGALSPGLRDRVMSQNANGYAEARWMGEVLPPEAVIVADMRSRALLPRPFAVLEMYGDPRIPSEVRRRRICEEVTARRVTALVVGRPPAESELVQVVGAARLLAGPAYFRAATRNPWNAGAAYRAFAFAVDGGCR